MLVPVAFFAMIAAIVIVPKYLRYKERARLHETLRLAFDKGQPVPPEIVEALTRRRGEAVAAIEEAQVYPLADRAQRDLRRGIVWLAIGLGFVVMGGAFYGMLYDEGGAVQTFAGCAGMGSIPACIGLAFIALWYVNRKESRA